MMILLLLVAALSGIAGEYAPGDEATVKVLSQHLFPSPAFYTQPIANLALGQVLEILEAGAGWYRVETAAGQTGWVHSSAITTASAGTGTVASGSGSVSQDEVTLAGRGFNSEIEAEYGSQNPQLDFDKVDEVEKNGVTPAELEAFLLAGGLVEEPLESQEQEQNREGGMSR